jgi:hypothetical protein
MSSVHSPHQFSPNFEPIWRFYLPLSLTHSCRASPIARPAAPSRVSSLLNENCCYILHIVDIYTPLFYSRESCKMRLKH